MVLASVQVEKLRSCGVVEIRLMEGRAERQIKYGGKRPAWSGILRNSYGRSREMSAIIYLTSARRAIRVVSV
jgi:hypothetical protein